jgi:hypothetical protein
MRDRQGIKRGRTNTKWTNFKEFDRGIGVKVVEVMSTILNKIVRTVFREGKGEDCESELVGNDRSVL